MKKIKVLVVCSEPELNFLVCKWLADFFRSIGGLYQARIVRSCDEAERHAEKGESFDLIVSDQTLPDGQGTALINTLLDLHRAIGADAPLYILMSGHPDVVAMDDPWILQKPFTPDGFRTMLEHRLNQNTSVPAA